MEKENKKGLFQKLKGSKFEGFLKKVGQSFPDILEVVGTGITNPVGAIKLVGEKLGEKKEMDENAKRLHHEFMLHQMDWVSELYQMEIDDRKSARERDVEIVKVTGKHDLMMRVVGSVILLSFILIVVTILFFTISEPQEKLVLHLMGITEGAVIAIVTFYYGSSRSSSEKTEILSQQMKQK